jgi:hypothetical protein
MNPPETNDPLDALLREQNNYVEDNGFTARVIDALPARKRRTWLRPTLLLGATGIGYVLAILWIPWKNIFDSSVFVSFNSQALLTIMLLLTIVGSLLWGVIAAVGLED